jgi:hypothetical protein
MIRGTLGLLAVALVSLSLGGAGCHKSGGTGGTGTGGAGGGDAATACAKLAAASCGRLKACLPLALSLEYGSDDTCAKRVGAQCEALQGLTGNTRTTARIDACATDYAALSCDAVVDGQVPATCADKGTLGAGSPCFVGAQCATGRCALGAGLPYGACGQCVAEVASGGACDFTGAKPCGADLFCGTDLTCHGFSQSGGPCDGKTSLCAPTFNCVGGACTAPVEKGGTCDPMQAQCDLAKGLACSSATKQCEALEVAQVGASCATDMALMLPRLCADSSLCVPGSTATLCVATVAEGGACVVDDMTHTSNCQIPLLCLDARCTYAPKCP